MAKQAKTKQQYNELEAQRLLMARKRAEARVVEIPKVVNWKRRNKCRNNPELFCKTYFPDLFFNPFTDNQRAIISAIAERFQIGGYQAIAAERGSGKTTIVKVVGAMWAVLYGHIKFIILIRANSRESKDMLADIKHFYATSPLLADDFPEVISCVDALDDSAQKAKKQTAKPADSDIEPSKTQIKWTEDTVVLPDVMMLNSKGNAAKSPSAGAVITTRGIDGSIRGAVKGKLRPDLVILDDVETDESANSEVIKQKIKNRIQKDIAGLAGTKKKMPVVFIGTIIAEDCITAWLTDKNQNPAWNGIKQRRVVKFPDNEDMWHKYIQLRKDGQIAGDLTARDANSFYLQNKGIMDKGCIISNPYRFSDTKLADGSYLENSAIQAVYNDIADMGMDAFKSEYQNEPVIANAAITKIEQRFISAKLNGLEKGDTAGGTVTAFIDVHDSLLYWAVVSWSGQAIGKIVDYEAYDTRMPLRGTISESQRKEFADNLILEGLNDVAFKIDKYGVKMCLIDSGYKPQIVYAFCKTKIGSSYIPSKGGSGRAGVYTTPRPSATIKNVKGTCHLSYQQAAGIWLVEFNPNHYKLQVHNGFMTADIETAGSLSLFGNQPYIHEVISAQLCSEAWDSQLKRFVVISSFGNHYLDCLAGNCLAAHMLNITPMGVKMPIKREISPPSKTSQGGFLNGLSIKF